MTEVVLTARAQRDLRTLDPPIQRRILEKLRSLEYDPLATATRLTDPRIGNYRVRVGDWRVIFDLAENTVTVIRIGHRREIYR